MQNINNNNNNPSQFILTVCVGGAERSTIIIPDAMPLALTIKVEKSEMIGENDHIPLGIYTIKDIWNLEDGLCDPLRMGHAKRGSKRKASMITSIICVAIIRQTWNRWDKDADPVQLNIDWNTLVESRLWGNFHPKNNSKTNIKSLNLEINKRLRDPELQFSHMSFDLIMVNEVRI